MLCTDAALGLGCGSILIFILLRQASRDQAPRAAEALA